MSSTQINYPVKNLALQLIPHTRAALSSESLCCITLEKQQHSLNLNVCAPIRREYVFIHSVCF